MSSYGMRWLSGCLVACGLVLQSTSAHAQFSYPDVNWLQKKENQQTVATDCQKLANQVLAPAGLSLHYVACIDATTDTSLNTLHLYRIKNKTGEAPIVEPAEKDALWPNLPLTVFVWYKDKPPEVTLSGSDGFDTGPFDPSKPPSVDKPSGASTPPTTVLDVGPNKVLRIAFHPQRPSFGRLIVKRFEALKDDPAQAQGEKPAKTKDGKPDYKDDTRSFPFVIERKYLTAFRIGVAIPISPWAENLKLRTGGGGIQYVVKDPDKAAAVFDGAELVAGISRFFYPQSVSFPHFGGAIGAQLGVLKASTSGATGLTSARLALELTYGVDYALGIAGGLNRHDVATSSFQVGAPAPAGATSIATRFGWTPGFAVYLSLTPSILRTLGIAGGG